LTRENQNQIKKNGGAQAARPPKPCQNGGGRTARGQIFSGNVSGVGGADFMAMKTRKTMITYIAIGVMAVVFSGGLCFSQDIVSPDNVKRIELVFIILDDAGRKRLSLRCNSLGVYPKLSIRADIDVLAPSLRGA
jgi:hypothetical protein